MKRAFIVHGWDGSPQSHWYPWLKEELEKIGFKVRVPAMPDTSEPNIEKWVSHLKGQVGTLDEETFFIGHSIGCQTIMRYLEKAPSKVKVPGVVFVAGWFVLENLEDEEVEQIAKPWISTPLDFSAIKSKIKNLSVFLSSNDLFGCVEENARLFREKLGAQVIIEKNKGHFTEGDGFAEIPQVLDIIKKYTE